MPAGGRAGLAAHVVCQFPTLDVNRAELHNIHYLTSVCTYGNGVWKIENKGNREIGAHMGN